MRSSTRGFRQHLALSPPIRRSPRTDDRAEPGKILHETRRGDGGPDEVRSRLRQRRFHAALRAAGRALHERTGDLKLIRRLWPHIRRRSAGCGASACRWRRLSEYDRKSLNGLINQGWKDSADAVMHEDGSLAEAPIALAEVQAYAYAAYLGASTMAAALSRPAEAAELEELARQLKRRFEVAFWLEDLGTYALALDGAKRPCRVRSSNAGHVRAGL
jgi:glycogen debranching enzyme